MLTMQSEQRVIGQCASKRCRQLVNPIELQHTLANTRTGCKQLPYQRGRLHHMAVISMEAADGMEDS